MFKYKKYLVVFLALLLVPFVSGCVLSSKQLKVEVDVSDVAVVTSTEEELVVFDDKKPVVIEKETTTEKVVAEIPFKLELPVAFAQQAPFGNWDQLHQEACEETSIIMASRYFNQQKLDESIMEGEIQKLIGWQTDNGYKVDLSAKETQTILTKQFGLKAKLSTEVTVDKIKYELSKGNLIIIPAAGRELGNPNFKQPGPIYHMLLIKGYNNKEFITNDPGTRKGNGWRYKYDTLIDAIHDWDHQLAEGGMTDEEIAQGQKIMIIVSK